MKRGSFLKIGILYLHRTFLEWYKTSQKFENMVLNSIIFKNFENQASNNCIIEERGEHGWGELPCIYELTQERSDDAGAVKTISGVYRTPTHNTIIYKLQQQWWRGRQLDFIMSKRPNYEQ